MFPSPSLTLWSLDFPRYLGVYPPWERLWRCGGPSVGLPSLLFHFPGTITLRLLLPQSAIAEGFFLFVFWGFFLLSPPGENPANYVPNKKPILARNNTPVLQRHLFVGKF